MEKVKGKCQLILYTSPGKVGLKLWDLRGQREYSGRTGFEKGGSHKVGNKLNVHCEEIRAGPDFWLGHLGQWICFEIGNNERGVDLGGISQLRFKHVNVCYLWKFR